MRKYRLAWVLLVAFGAAAPPLASERLAIHRLGQTEGLASDRVNCLLEDSRGLLWVGTTSGLSRFDGERFVSYGTADGLPNPSIQSVLEDASGRLWVATAAGLARMLPARDGDGRLFRAYTFEGTALDQIVRTLLEDSAGRLWVGVGGRLFRLDDGGDEASFREVDLGIEWLPDEAREVRDLAEGRDGSLWVATTIALLRLAPDGRQIRYPVAPAPDVASVLDLLVDSRGRLWILGAGVLVYQPDSFDVAVEGPLSERARPIEPALDRLPEREGEVVRLLGLPASGYSSAIELRDGEVWIGSGFELDLVSADGWRKWTEANGLGSHRLSALLEDREGNVWIATYGLGLLRLDRQGFVSFGPSEGLATENASSIVPDGEGGVLVVGSPASSYVHVLRDGTLEAVRLPIEQDPPRPGWGWNQVTWRDSRGEWWVPTSGGLYRFARQRRVEDLAHARPLGVYGLRSELGSDRIFRLFEDSRSDVWVGAFGPVRLARFERATGRFRRLAPAAGAPSDVPTAFAEDAGGAVWIGFYEGGVARYRDGRFETFGAAEGVPVGFVSTLLADARGALWLGTSSGGLARAVEPTAPRPRFAPAPGLPPGGLDRVNCLVEDLAGRIYVGTDRGIERLDPERGVLRHFDTANGLAGNEVVAARRDGRGDLWFATSGGASRLHPVADGPPRPPRIQITEVRAGGRALPVPELGVPELAPFRVPAGVYEIEIGFGAVDLSAIGGLRYQVSVDSRRDGEWDPPSRERRVHLVGLGPGEYQFRARALRGDGVASAPVTLPFTVMPPFWRRGAFLTAVGLLVVAAVVGAVRLRLRRLAALQAVRERISADLHDELGLSLSRIAMLSEVARRRAGPAAEESLVTIGDSARELIDATSDMAWALDPRRDDLGSLLARLRRLASDVFEGAGVAWSFDAPDCCDRLPLAAEVRRHLFLILKEALHNAARHSGASTVRLALAVREGCLEAEVRDDGRGFDAGGRAPGADGSGVASMTRRARELGGELEIESSVGRGTRVRLRAPVGRDRRPACGEGSGR
ncbi:MAG: hypothetical protein KDB94_12285 [Acidobacteria bacterium]|nr:hypothetical protein [Acidobacteriota bacterium]